MLKGFCCSASGAVVCLFLLLLSRYVESATITHTPEAAVKNVVDYIITDGSNAASYDTHVYSFSVTGASKYRFVFKEFYFYSAELIIQETRPGDDSPTTLYSCASCGNKIPPPFDSATGQVIMYAKGATGVSFSASAFSLQYVSFLATADANMNTIDLIMTPGYAHITPIFLSDGNLQGQSQQSWYIDTTNSSTSTEIKFSLSSLNLPSDCSTTLYIYDHVNVGIRNLLFSGCSSADFSSEWMYSYTSRAFVYLDNSARSADASASFELIYLSEKPLYQCGSLEQPDVLVREYGIC